jgi:hypothetical protein
MHAHSVRRSPYNCALWIVKCSMGNFPSEMRADELPCRYEPRVPQAHHLATTQPNHQNPIPHSHPTGAASEACSCCGAWAWPGPAGGGDPRHEASPRGPRGRRRTPWWWARASSASRWRARWRWPGARWSWSRRRPASAPAPAPATARSSTPASTTRRAASRCARPPAIFPNSARAQCARILIFRLRAVLTMLDNFQRSERSQV